MTIAQNIQTLQQTIQEACQRANRDPSNVTLIAISKKKPVKDIFEAIEAGLQHFGENRVEESQIKIPKVNQQTQSKLIWHMVGHIQSRKAKQVVPLFEYVHSVDSLKIAQKLSQSAQEQNQVCKIFLEINISGEASKYGFQAGTWETRPTIKQELWQEFATIKQLPFLEIQGLMTMAPIVENTEQTRPVFADLVKLQIALRTDFDVKLPHLSMGMTDDYPIAIEEGATVVRVGRAIFGERID
jgi:pyridoxal phosphate enzyme (YggS family)